MTEAVKESTETVPTVEELNTTAYAAYDAYVADPTDENKTAAKEAVKLAKEGQTTANEAAATAAKAKEKTDAETKAADEKNKPPETYTITKPEKSTLSDEHVEAVKALAKEKGLSNEAAQSILERDHALLVTFAEAQAKDLDGKKAEWFEQAKADKEIGGDNLEKNIELSKRVTTKFFTPEFAKVLVATGFGNHPELVRGLTRIGNAMSEDQLEVPVESGTGGKSPADVLYGGESKKKK